MKNLFAVVLRYIAPIERVDAYRPAHITFLEKYYQKGVFLVSGVQTPKTGGVILARGGSRSELQDILKEDPFFTEGLAEYQMFEFGPTRWSASFKKVLDEMEALG